MTNEKLSNINLDLDKYSSSIFNNFDISNFNKIVSFFEDNNFLYLEDIIEDYFDIFCFSFDEFISKYNLLNLKYNNQFLELVSSDFNYLEKFYEI